MKQLELNPSQQQIDRGAELLANNTYPGRVIIMGINNNETLALQVYALTGRSEGSRNRVFSQEGRASVRTIAPDMSPEEMSLVEGADLIYYRATNSQEDAHVVSNGAQTDPVLQGIIGGKTLEEALRGAPKVAGGTDGEGGKKRDVDLSKYEPDAPNNTPRITGVIDLREKAPTPFGLIGVRKDPESDYPIYSAYGAEIEALSPGVGYAIQTYHGDGDPLPSFGQEPYAFPLGDGLFDTAQMVWNKLNKEKRVAILVHGVDLITKQSVGTVIFNK